MRLLNLNIKNIGPFIKGNIEFISKEDNTQNPPVTIITGENGTGKTIIIDAIRALLATASRLERNIIRDANDFSARLEYSVDGEKKVLSSSKSISKNIFFIDPIDLNDINRRFEYELPTKNWNWVIDYWTSKLSTDSFEIDGLLAPVHEDLYKNSLNGIQKNVEISQLICHFDYIKTSENETERELGIRLFDIIKKIIKLSLVDGQFKYVSRATLQPIVMQMGQEITLEKLSSGNLYLMQRMISLLGKMYSIHILNRCPIEELCQTRGVLLIDEAENHLHPKWQKTFISSILDVFPNLQIIVTTYSPFIVSSVENSKIFVCSTLGDHAEIADETDVYSNKPIEEILLSPLFGATYPFNQEITELLQKRKQAIDSKDMLRKNEIEKKLKNMNPQYFKFLDIDNILEEITSK